VFEARKILAAAGAGAGAERTGAPPRPSRAAVVTLPVAHRPPPADPRPAPSMAAYDQLLDPPAADGSAGPR
jgi:hypothetical protein